MTGKRGKKNRAHKKGGKNPHANLGMQVQVPQLRVTLPYFFYSGITESATGLGAFYSFSVNSLFDPDFSGGGLQPLGFDQYAQFYGRYRVTGVKASVTFSARTSAPCIVGMYFTPQSTLPAVPSAWPVVNRTSRFATICSNTGGPAVHTFTQNASLPDVFGITRPEFTNEMDFAALMTNSPARLAYLHLFTIGRGAVASVDFTIKLDMQAELSQPVSLSLS